MSGAAAPIKQIINPPKPPPPPPPPVLAAPVPLTGGESETAQVNRAKDLERDAARRRSGRKSTILTGALGVTDQATTQKKTLLGQ